MAELTPEQVDEIRAALRLWLPASYEGGVRLLVPVVAQLLTDQRERIAQELIARNVKGHGEGCLCLTCAAFAECAHIARG